MNTIYRLISTIIDLTSLDRYGKQSSSTYGKIDDLTCSYDGNHLTAISDNAPIPTISGSFDFKDEVSTTAEYLYDENGLRPDVTKGNNNRVVVAENDSIVQINHYYPYGGVIGDISTNKTCRSTSCSITFHASKLGARVLAAIKRRLIISWREDEPLGEG